MTTDTRPEDRNLPRALYLLAAVPAGLLFLIAACGKMLDLPSLLEGIARITGLPSGVATLLALCLIATELTGGILLILAIRPRLTAGILAALMSLFLLLQPLLDGPDGSAPCNCFGTLTPAMSASAHIALDVSLLGLLLLIALSAHLRPARWSYLLAGALLLPGLLEFAGTGRETPAEPRQALAYAQNTDPLFASAAGTRAILLLDFRDFACPPCYENILQTAATFSRCEGNSHRIIILIRRHLWSLEQAEARAERWKRATGISLPTSTIADSVLGPAPGSQSSVALFDRKGGLLMHATFPVSESAHHRLLEFLRCPANPTP